MTLVVDADDGPDLDDEETLPGELIINASLAATALFAVTSTLATINPDAFATAAAVVDVALFFVGCVVFLWSYALAISRSRTDVMGIGGLYFLSGSAPQAVRLRLLGALAAQVVIAVVSASIRPFTSVAFGVLVPVLGLGLCGLWAARFGTFPPRDDDRERPSP